MESEFQGRDIPRNTYGVENTVVKLYRSKLFPSEHLGVSHRKCGTGGQFHTETLNCNASPSTVPLIAPHHGA